jgi:hypothetical protein
VPRRWSSPRRTRPTGLTSRNAASTSRRPIAPQCATAADTCMLFDHEADCNRDANALDNACAREAATVALCTWPAQLQPRCGTRLSLFDVQQHQDMCNSLAAHAHARQDVAGGPLCVRCLRCTVLFHS